MRPLQPTARRVWTRTLVGASALALALAFLVASCSSPSRGEPPGGRFGPDTPKVGACRVLAVADIAPTSNSTPTVPCSSPHTAVTISVGGFPESQVTNPRLRSGALGNKALQRCTAAWRRTVGGTVESRHTTVLGLAYYLPNPGQLSHGARWYRCDLVMGGSDGMSLQDLPRKVDGLLDPPVSDTVVACRTAPDFHNGREVPCSHPHVLRAIGIAQLPDRPSYPSGDVLRNASTKGCTAVVRQWLHGRVGSGAAFQWPDQVSWDVLHDHIATCWAVTTD
jgi:hypothetical protein